MPIISEFMGIKITMYHNDKHHNLPHFHAIYGEYAGSFDLQGNMLVGDLPRKQKVYIETWADIYHEELLLNWELAKSHQGVIEIAGLEKKKWKR
jgi:hypothetical protein